MEITPPHLKSISICQLAPSSRSLVIGNEQAQYFYVYELYPQSNRRINCKCATQFRLQAVLFRGYTSTLITDCSIKQLNNHLQVMLNSSNGTTHTYIIEN